MLAFLCVVFAIHHAMEGNPCTALILFLAFCYLP